MKNKFFFLAIAFLYCTGTQAQISRLIGLTKTKYNGLDFTTVGDTINYMYTGAMDTSRRGAIAFDSSYSMVSGTGYTPGNLSYRSYQTFVDTYNIASVRIQSYDTASTSWQNYQYTTTTYDAANNITQNILQVKDPLSGGWLNSTNSMYTYTGTNEITRILQAWKTTLSTPAWVNREKDSFAYDGSNNMIYHLAQTWDSTALNWRNTNQFFDTYNTLNQVTNVIRQTWDITSGSWKNNTKTNYDYNAANLLANTIVQRWDTGLLVWNNLSADSLLYNTTNDKTTETIQRWDTAAHAWANMNMHKLTYDANHKPVTDTTLNWSNPASAFLYNKLRLNSYNSFSQLLVTTTESWNTGTSSWIYRLGGGGPAGGSDIQWRYYYEMYPSTSVVEHGTTAHTSTLLIYPDPASNVLNVKLDWGTATPFAVAIYDASGRVVRQWKEAPAQNYTRTVPVNDLPTGTYVITARSAGEQMTQQFVISK